MLVKSTWANLKRINWDAVFRCGAEYKRKYPSHNDGYYWDYLEQTYGLRHGDSNLDIVDEQKYMLFVLKWS